MPKPDQRQRAMAANVRRLRRFRRWSARHLARSAHLPFSEIVRIETPTHGDHVSDDTIKGVARALDVDWLDLGITPEEDPDEPLLAANFRTKPDSNEGGD